MPELPYSSLDSDNPEDLWDELDRQREQGMQVFAIPHNGNVSNGLMYDAVTWPSAHEAVQIGQIFSQCLF